MAAWTIQIAERPGVSLHCGIAEAVREAVVSGRMAPGVKLPAHRDLAKSLGVNPMTVRRAYELLENQGIVFRRQGSGTYVQPEALRKIQQIGKRRIATVIVVLGQTSLAKYPREMLFIVTDFLDGIRDVLGGRQTHYVFVESLTRECLGDLDENSAVLLFFPKKIDAALAEELMQRRIPLLGVWQERAPLEIPYISYDRHHAAALACQHLLDCGYKRIGFIGIKAYQGKPIIPVKFFVFTSLLQEAGLDIHALYVRQAHINPSEAYAAVWDIISAGDLPEAFFVDTDYKAMEVIHALNNAGLKVPDDVAVVSYDDIPEAATFAPPLTTVSVPRREIGQQAAQMLLDWPESGPLPQSVVLNATLLLRDSSILRRGPVKAEGGAAS